MSRAVQYILRTPMAIAPDALELMLEIAHRENRPIEVIERELGRELRSESTVRVRDGVAVVPVIGPLIRYANLFSRVSGATSLEVLSTEFHEALRAQEVRAVLLAINSPGGEVSGIDDFAELVFRARSLKPIVAHISGRGASGGYWIASAAREIVVSSAAIVGNIGAVLSIDDYSKQMEEAGVRRFTFVSSVSPRKVMDPKTDQGAEDIQRIIDELGETFVAAVARFRGISAEEVIERGGGGTVFVGEHAVVAGLADRVGTLEDVITQLQEETAKRPSVTVPGLAGNPSMKEKTMSEAAAAPEDLTIQVLKEKHPELVAELSAEGAMQGRKDALAILALHAPGGEELRAELAADPTVTVEAAARRLIEAQAERARAQGDAFISGRKKDESGNPQPAASTEDGMGDADRLVAAALATEALAAPGGV